MKKKPLEGELCNNLLKAMRIMRLSLFFIIVSTTIAFSSNSYSQSIKLSIELENKTVREVISEIETQSEFIFFYQKQQLDLERKVTIQVRDQNIQLILDQLFAGTDNTYVVNDRQIVIGKQTFKKVEEDLPVIKEEKEVESPPQKKEIKGKVVDSNGLPLPGVTVVVKGTTTGTVTDLDGVFSLDVPIDAQILLVSFVGMKTQELRIDDNVEFSVVLEEEAVGLEEVVAIGYGVQKKESVVGAISSVKNEELIKSPVANVSNALAGRLNGVSFIQKGGEPGKDQSTIYIRGLGTLEPSLSSPLIIIDGVERTSMDGIDMNEIETINVLKDASATAVYGVRGANGVILLTTKTGTVSKPKVSFSSNIGVQTPTDIPGFLTPYQYALLKNEGLANDNPYATPIFTEEDLQKFQDGSDPVFYPVSEYYKTFFKKLSLTQHYNINVIGGTEKVKYFVSLGFYDQDGQYNTDAIEELNLGYDPNPNYKRYNFRSNLDISLTKDLTASIKLGNQMVNANYAGQATSDLFFSMLQQNPLSGPGIVDGKLISGYINDPLSSVNYRGASAATLLSGLGYQTILENTLNLNVGLKYNLDKITKGLSVRAMYAYDHWYQRYETRYKARDTYDAMLDPDSGETIFVQTNFEGAFSYSGGNNVSRVGYLETAVDYSNSFGNHDITGLVLYNQRKLHKPGLVYNVPEGLQGLVGRVTYAYSNKYFAEFNIGYNGSENFPKGKRFGLFPAYSLGWVITEESFIPESKILSYLKIRGSYGEVGNDKLSGSRFIYLPSAYSYGGTVYTFGTDGIDVQKYSGASEGKIGNPDVTWERSKKTNIGFNSRFFDARLSVSGNYFQENRENILINRATIPQYVGVTSLPAANIGKIKNHGYELEAKWNGNIEDFHYSIGAQMSYAKNEIVFKDEPAKQYEWMQQTGFSIGQQFGYKSDGFYNYIDETYNRPYNTFYGNLIQQGDVKYIDIDGDGIIDQNDVVPIGYSQYPEINYGFFFDCNYKNFDFSLLFQGADHVTVFQREMIGWAYDWEWRMTLAEHLNRWTQERFDNGETITMPRLSNSGNNSPSAENSDFWQHDAGYLRLKNLEIGYTIKSERLKNMGINDFRFYLNGNNLLTFTPLKDFDPEAPSGRGQVYPQMKVFNAGLTFKF